MTAKIKNFLNNRRENRIKKDAYRKFDKLFQKLETEALDYSKDPTIKSDNIALNILKDYFAGIVPEDDIFRRHNILLQCYRKNTYSRGCNFIKCF